MHAMATLYTRIGLLSDSHGRGPITARAVDLLLEHGAQVLVHLGDIGSEPVIDALAVGDRAEARLVFGNCDWDSRGLRRYAQDVGVRVDDPAGRIDTPRGPLVFCHGHQHAPLIGALQQGAAYLCHGHTHVQTDRRDGPTRVINPGALHRAAAYSVALLDAEADVLAFYEVPRI